MTNAHARGDPSAQVDRPQACRGISDVHARLIRSSAEQVIYRDA